MSRSWTSSRGGGPPLELCRPQVAKVPILRPDRGSEGSSRDLPRCPTPFVLQSFLSGGFFIGRLVSQELKPRLKAGFRDVTSTLSDLRDECLANFAPPHPSQFPGPAPLSPSQRHMMQPTAVSVA